MKSCIGFILDLSIGSKNQLSDLNIKVERNTVATFLPFMNLISNMINDKYDIFVGSCGVDRKHGLICDIILLLQYLSNHEWLPILEETDSNSRQNKNEFIRKLREVGATEISKITERQLNEYQCKYLLSAFENDPNVYYEIGYEEYREFHKENADEYFKIYPQAKRGDLHVRPSSVLLLIFMPVIGLGSLVSDAIHNRDMLTYQSLITNQYNKLINRVLFSVLRKYDWKTIPEQFLLCSSNEIMTIVSNLFKRAPPNCKKSIVDALKTFFFETIPRFDLSLKAAYNTFGIKRYLNRYLVIISSGVNNGRAKETKEIYDAHCNDAKIICCYLSQSKIDNYSKQLYFKCPPNITDSGRRLFEMSSMVQINFTVKSILESRGWIIPSTGMCKLFLHVNDPQLIKEFLAIITDIIQNNDVLSNVLGTTIIQKYVNHNISNFKTTDQGREKICWSHACATVIHMSIARITGRQLPSFISIRDHLLNQFGRQGQRIANVLDKVLYKQYKLRYKSVNENGAKDALIHLRPCVASFHLTALQWFNFGRFFASNKTGILTSEIINEKCIVPQNEVDGGHAVVLIDFGDGYLTFLNSWGEKWGDNGKFRVKNSEVLGGVIYYDIFWTVNDLSKNEKLAWNNKKTTSLTDLIWNAFKKSPETKLKCPHCSSFSQAKSFYGNCSKCICPVCFNFFVPTIDYISKNLNK